MDFQDFLEQHSVGQDRHFQAGLVSIDIAGHSELGGSDQEIAAAKEALKHLVETQLNESGTLLRWEGDGGIVLFHADDCDQLLVFADQIRHLVLWFNRTKGSSNKLPYNPFMIRIVCHMGELLNVNDEPGSLSGTALNLLAKRERDIGRPGYVVLTSDVYRRLTGDSLQKRCELSKEHPDFGKVYVLDGKLSPGMIWRSDHRSEDLKEWIIAACSRHQYEHLFYFGYTNEQLFHFLGYELEGLEVRVLVRNWVVEHEDEERFNSIIEASEGTERGRRPWYKARIIQSRAEEIVKIASEVEKPIDIRFYNDPPTFNGAILLGNSGESCAFVGVFRWEKEPEEGGSQYKLGEWPAIVLDSRDTIQAQLINSLHNHFQRVWEYSSTYEQVCIQEEELALTGPAVIGQFWKLDGQPYLIIYPQRRDPERAFPVVAYEDVMAFHLIERFLNEYGTETRLQTFQLPDKLEGEWYPSEVQQEIEAWPGHVIFICTKSVPPGIKKSLLGNSGFPYEVGGIGTPAPYFKHRTRGDLALVSPTDKDPAEPRDYSLIARFKRPEKGSMAYIAAGIRAMGTWGAAHYITDRGNIRKLASLITTDQFAAIVETTFDPHKYEVTNSRLHIMPEEFQVTPQ